MSLVSSQYGYLNQPLQIAVFQYTNNLPCLARVCKSFKSTAEKTAEMILNQIKDKFGEVNLLRMIKHLKIGKCAPLKKVEGLFRRVQVSMGPYDVNQLMPLFASTGSKKSAQELIEQIQNKFGKKNYNSLIKQLQLENCSEIEQIQRLFEGASDYKVNQLKALFAPYLRFDDMLKFWLAIYGLVSEKMRAGMSEISMKGNDLDVQFEMSAFLEKHADELASIKELNLTGMNLFELPKQIGLFTGLENLDLSTNNLSDLPLEFGNLKSLVKLNLNDNEFEVFPSVILELVDLNILEFSDNILRLVPEEIDCLVSLTNLGLNQNLIKSLPGSICRLYLLKYLGLEFNHLTSLPESIGDLEELKFLYLHHNELISIPASIGELDQLLVFSVSDNKLQSLPQEIGLMKNLKLLNVMHNHLTQLPDTICKLNVNMLFIGWNGLTTLPAELGAMGLQFFIFEGNPFSALPQALSGFPYWSQDPLKYPRAEQILSGMGLNEGIYVPSMKVAYLGLGENKWMECIDGEYHHFGKEVFDKGLHGRDVEPGYIASMENLFVFLKNNMNRKIDAQFYLQMHKIACAHFRGEENGVEINQDQTGQFRDTDQWVNAHFDTKTHAFSEEGTEEFYKLNQQLVYLLGPSFSLGKIIPTPLGASIEYNAMSATQIHLIFNLFLTEFYFEIGHSTSQKMNLVAIARLIQRLQWLHTTLDGCGRLDMALMNYLLCIYGFHPVLLKYPYLSSCRGIDEWVEILEEGLRQWKIQRGDQMLLDDPMDLG